MEQASAGRIDSKWQSVTKQAGIYAGEDGYDIEVGNTTILERYRGLIVKTFSQFIFSESNCTQGIRLIAARKSTSAGVLPPNELCVRSWL